MKSPQNLFSCAILAISLGLSQAAHADTQYVNDMLRVDMRAGPTNTHKIIDFIKSGTPVNVISQSPDGVWYQVEANGKQGWIQAQYLTHERVARDMLVDAQAEIEKIKKHNETLQDSLSDTRTELKSLKAAHKQLNSGSVQLQRELENIQRISKEAISTEAALRDLSERNQMLETELEKLTQENQLVKAQNMREGIQFGILAMLAGIIATLVIPRITARRRRDVW
ncbi:SH3 domain protein [gamma proteobacterium HdN1]|nr:SH3 domain protein [gamma proteobacterium HdN1]